MTIIANFERFQYFNFERDFLEYEKLFQKAGLCFLTRNTKIQNASSPYKIATSEANVKTNRMEGTKWTYRKKQRFASNYFYFFWEFCFSLRNSYKELIWCTNEPNANIRTFRKRWNFFWRCFFPVNNLKIITSKAVIHNCSIE